MKVDHELRRARRIDDEERFYRDVISGATQIGQIAPAIDLAAIRGDVPELIELFQRYDRLQTGRPRVSYGTTSYAFQPVLALGKCMSAGADRKHYSQVLTLLDFTIDAARRKHQQQSPGAAARARRARLSAVTATRTLIWVGSSLQTVRIDFPRDNEYLDTTVRSALRTAFELYKRDDLASDLVSHFRRQAAAAPTPTDAIFPRLALSALLWWNDDHEAAIAELTKVVESCRPESELRLDLAEVLLEQGSPADALEILDAVQPLDNMSLTRREELAVMAAIAAGDTDRARRAAERLFGLRLDTDTQIRLSGQMHQLGLHELADALLGRARRRAGGQSGTLVPLMTQFQRQRKLEAAAQIAMQILRASRTSQGGSARAVAQLETDASRTAAMRVLATSGRLPQLIERTRRQLEKTPSSVAIHLALADYYTAANQTDQAALEMRAHRGASARRRRAEDADGASARQRRGF